MGRPPRYWSLTTPHEKCSDFRIWEAKIKRGHTLVVKIGKAFLGRLIGVAHPFNWHPPSTGIVSGQKVPA